MLACSALALRTRMKISLSLALACSGSALALVAALCAVDLRFLLSLISLACVCSLALRAPRLAGSLYALERKFLSRFLLFWLAFILLLRSLALIVTLVLLMPSFSFSDEPIVPLFVFPFLHLDGLHLS